MTKAPAHPARLIAFQQLPLRRWAALFAVLLGLLCQTLHTHAAAEDTFHPQGKHTLLASQSSDLCPLCLAAQTASPAPAVEAVALPLLPLATSFDPGETFHATQPAFAHFSRPPPALLL